MIKFETTGLRNSSNIVKERVCVELKTEADGDVKTQIRSAIGQLFEYNYYPGREIADQWIIGTDTKPRRKDLEFIDNLREVLQTELYLIWQSKTGFKSYPNWP